MTQSLSGSRWFCLAVILMAIGLGSQARGAMMTFNYSGSVAEILVDGPDTLDDEFSFGETVNISLTYDTDAPETVLNANTSTYADPLISFSFEFVQSGRQFDMTGGSLQVISVLNDFNNLGTVADNLGVAAILGGGATISGTVNGVTPIIMSLSFIDFESEPAVPDMLSDTSLPATPLDPDRIILRFQVNNDDAVTVGVEVPEPGTGLIVLAGAWLLARRPTRPRPCGH